MHFRLLSPSYILRFPRCDLVHSLAENVMRAWIDDQISVVLLDLVAQSDADQEGEGSHLALVEAWSREQQK